MIKRLIISFSILLASAGLIFSARPAAAFDPFGGICASNPSATVCQDKQQSQDAGGSNSIYGKDSILARATFIISIVIGIASVIVIIIGGIKYIMSGGEEAGRRHGDPSGLNSARNTILYALIGVGIALAGQAIVAFVLNKL